MLRTGQPWNTRWRIRPRSSTYAHPTLVFLPHYIYYIFLRSCAIKLIIAIFNSILNTCYFDFKLHWLLLQSLVIFLCHLNSLILDDGFHSLFAIRRILGITKKIWLSATLVRSSATGCIPKDASAWLVGFQFPPRYLVVKGEIRQVRPWL